MFRSILLVTMAGVFCVGAFAQTTEFTYQGNLKVGASPTFAPEATVNYDFEFRLCNSDSASCAAAPGLIDTYTHLNVPVTDGGFSVKLNFTAANAFDGSPRWLEIYVRPAGGGAFTPLTPRQQITSTPYAIKSKSADTSTNSQQLGGVEANQYVITTDPRLSDPRPPTAGSTNYIQNQNASPQATGNFNISGDGTAAGTFSGNIVNAATQYNIGGSRILSNPGTSNLFAGVDAGNANTSGGANSFFGKNAGFSNTTGNSNSFLGSSAGFSNIGSGNTFFGVNAGYSNTTGDLNTIIGNGANVGSGDLTNATAIGASAFVNQNNSLVLGSINGVNFATADTRVGIGTIAPAYPLTVVGNAGAGANQAAAEFTGSTNDTGVRIRNTASSGRTYTFFSSGAGSGIGAGNFNIYDATAAQARLTIDPIGRVGIATTAPAYPLTVVGNAGAGATQAAAEFTGSTNDTGVRIRNTASSGRTYTFFSSGAGSGIGAGNFNIYDATADQARLTIDPIGRVGIATTGPLGRLQVVTSNDTTPLAIPAWDARHFVIGAAGSAGGIGMSYDQINNVGYIHSLSPSVLWRKLVLQAGGGNVGIGTSSPAATLEVNGYTKLGSDAPAIRVKKLTGTTSDHEGGPVNISHGLDVSKILSVSVMVEYSSGFWVGSDTNYGNGIHFSWVVQPATITIVNTIGGSAGILSKPIKILITYEQ